MANLPDQPHVRMSGPYGVDQLERAIRDLGPVISSRADGEQEHLFIDLSGLVYVGPAAPSVLAAVLKAREEDGCACTVIPPKSPLTRNYLQRMDFTKLLFKSEIPEPFKRKEPVGSDLYSTSEGMTTTGRPQRH